MKHEFELTASIEGPITSDELEVHIGAVMEALSELGYGDAAIVGSVTDLTVTFAVEIEAHDGLAAVDAGVALIRSAVHATGAATPGWDVAGLAIETRPGHLVDV